MKKPARELPEIWRDIRETDGLYQVSSWGRVRKIWPKSGKVKIMKLYVNPHRKKNANRQTLRVHMTCPDGRRIERPVIKLVAQAFFAAPEGMRSVHRNGLHTDNSLDNIIFLTDRELGEKFGSRAARRPVIKINSDGETVACYTSARAAARNNYLSYQTVMDRCNGKVKKEFALDGFSYRWDDLDKKGRRKNNGP